MAKTKAKKGTKKPSQEDFTSADKIENEDLMIINLRMREKDVAQLKLQLLQMQLEKVQAEAEGAENHFQQLMGNVNEKYGLSPRIDKFDIATGEIQRGE